MPRRDQQVVARESAESERSGKRGRAEKPDAAVRGVRQLCRPNGYGQLAIKYSASPTMMVAAAASIAFPAFAWTSWRNAS